MEPEKNTVEESLNRIDLQIDDEINLDNYVAQNEFTSVAKSQIEQKLIPVQRPDPQSWIWIPADPNMKKTVSLLAIKRTNSFYLVRPEVAGVLDGDVKSHLIVPYQDRDGGLFIWAVKLYDAYGSQDTWTLSALRIIYEDADSWIQIRSHKNISSYNAEKITIEVPAPKWPPGGLSYMVNRAFKSKVINSTEDPIIQRLRGLL